MTCSARFTSILCKLSLWLRDRGGGEFFTPRSVVRLIIELIAPCNGTVFDPACGSGGMFVQSAKFVDHRRKELMESDEPSPSVYGQEKTVETVKLAKMNIAVIGPRDKGAH